MSKNNNLSINTLREANNIEFETYDNILSGNNQPFGSPTIDSTYNGVHYPNVQAAIDDLASMFVLPINSVHVCTDGISPEPVSQTDEFKFSGTIANGSDPIGTKINFNFYGFPTEVLVGDTGEEVAGKVKKQLEIAQSNNHVFSLVNFGTSLDILQLRYNDSQVHNLKQLFKNGVKVVPNTISIPKSGYGTWEKLGTEPKNLSGGTGQITLHYFRRVS